MSGFPPLGGARFLREEGVDPRVVNLVAHHSHAVIEARERGLEDVLLDEFPLDASLPHAALCFCDMTPKSQAGERLLGLPSWPSWPWKTSSIGGTSTRGPACSRPCRRAVEGVMRDRKITAPVHFWPGRIGA